MLYFSTLLLSFFITITLIPVFRRAAIRMHAMDLPNPRKVHANPIPKCGGIAMAFGAIIPVVLLSGADPQLASILAGSGIIVIFGLLDDFKDVSYKFKFTGQIAAAMLVIFWGGISIQSFGTMFPDLVTLPKYISIPLSFIVIVGVTNAINLSDGLDGLAGGISMLGFALIGYLAFVSGNHLLTLLSFSVVGAIFGFLRFNSHPAKLFMGDAGSQLLGFLTITLSLAITQGGGPYTVMLPLMIAGYPVLDTLRVMSIRLMEGRHIFSADKNHLHHKLMSFGFHHAEVVFIIYLFQATLIISGYLLRYYSGWWSLALYLFLSGIVISGIAISEHKRWKLSRDEFSGISVLKKKVQMLFRERQIGVKTSFGMLKFILPLVFFVSCLLPSDIPFYLSFGALTFSSVLIVLLIYKDKWVETGIRLSVYMLIPFILYFGEIDRSIYFSPFINKIYDFFIFGLIVPAGLTMRFTRRKHGFKTSPMDFLIFFIAIAIALVPDFSTVPEAIRFMATKMIVLFFAYEVLIGELRGKVKILGWVTAATLTALALI